MLAKVSAFIVLIAIISLLWFVAKKIEDIAAGEN